MAKKKAKKKNTYDLIVIGSGSGGSVAANKVAAAGKRVAIVEKEALGGECPNFGCIPTKALLHAAEVYRTSLNASKFGTHTTKTKVFYKEVNAWKDFVVERTGVTHGEEIFHHSGIDVIKGNAHFLDKKTITVNRKRYKAKKFLIASGTNNFIPPIEGLSEAGFITYRQAIDFEKLPKSMLIIGGGAIGCEFAQIFSSFGVEVTIIDAQPRLLGREDVEISKLVQAIFEKRGITVGVGAKILNVKKTKTQKKATYECDGTPCVASVDEILVATGKRPNVDIGLENAGVSYDHKKGIHVNKYMQTSVKNIYAAGDVVGPYQFTHTAAYQSAIAGHNMLHRKNKKSPEYDAIPRCVFTSPEVAAVGMTEAEAKEKKIKVKIGAVPINIVGRSNTSNERTGFVKIIAKRDNHQVIGASIVAPHAGEMIHELALAIRLKAKTEDIFETVHAFPTFSEAIKLAAHKV